MCFTLAKEVCAMGVLRPIYTDSDLKDMSVANRQQLSQAISELLRTDPDVKKLLRDKTVDLFNRLKPTT
jgi:hypothetical protein